MPSYLQADRRIDTPKVFAANLLVSLPTVIVYLSPQRLFRQAMASGSANQKASRKSS
jgi:raffinose/stachyose/melibiose transport system permease protein